MNLFLAQSKRDQPVFHFLQKYFLLALSRAGLRVERRAVALLHRSSAGGETATIKGERLSFLRPRHWRSSIGRRFHTVCRCVSSARGSGHSAASAFTSSDGIPGVRSLSTRWPLRGSRQ